MELYPASIDGIDLEVEVTDDTFEKAIARHEVPGTDGALLEDMGQRARVVNLRCYFWDDGEHLTYQAHIDLVNHLRSTGLSDLTHPMYGPMRGMVERVSVRHDDSEMAAEVDLTFVEQLRDEIPPVAYEDVEAATEDAALDSVDEQGDELTDDLSAAGLDPAAKLDPDKTLLEQAKELGASASSAIREVVAELDSYIAVFEATVTEVMQPVNSAMAAVNYAANLPGRVLGPINQAVERVASLYTGLKSFPSRFTSGLSFQYAQLLHTVETASGSTSSGGTAARALVVKHLRIACARQLALEAAASYAADEKRRQALRRREQAKSFDAAGRYLGESAAEPVANVRDLESSLSDVRGWIADTVAQTRSQGTLKTMAATLLTHVDTVKLEREKIVTITLDNPTPLHLVCLAHGLPYNYAERILALNPQIQNPSYASGEVQIYVR